jgi:hypothetical protein
MNIRRAFAFSILAAAVPASLVAQGRGIMGGRGAMTPGRGGGNIARDAGIYIPKYANIVNLLVEHRPDLALNDSQFTRIIAIKRSLDSTNAPLLRKLDSVQRLFRAGVPMFSTPSAQRRDSLAEARSLIIETIGSIRDNVGAARDKAYAFLSASQVTKAQEMEDKAERAVLEENQKGERATQSRGGGGSVRPPTG